MQHIVRIDSVHDAGDDDIVFSIREYAMNPMDIGMHSDRIVVQLYAIRRDNFNGLSGFAREWIMSHRP